MVITLIGTPIVSSFTKVKNTAHVEKIFNGCGTFE
jgi:hypothetical protein